MKRPSRRISSKAIATSSKKWGSGRSNGRAEGDAAKISAHSLGDIPASISHNKSLLAEEKGEAVSIEAQDNRQILIQPEDFIRAFYQAVLGRDPDASGFTTHTQSLAANFSISGLFHKLSEFADSDEAQNRNRLLAEAEATRGSSANSTLLNGDPVRHLLSIGSHCLTSSTLRSLGLKRYSGPFDWIFSSLPMVTHCIEDDFKTFLDTSHYRLVAPTRRVTPDANVCDHMFYRSELGVKFVFNHDDVTKPDRYDYFRRCVGRFRAALQSPERTLLIGICRFTSRTSGEFEKLARLLEKKANNTQLLIVAADEKGGGAFANARGKLLKALPTGWLVKLEGSSTLGELEFHDKLDTMLLARMIYSFGVDLSDGPPLVSEQI